MRLQGAALRCRNTNSRCCAGARRPAVEGLLDPSAGSVNVLELTGLRILKRSAKIASGSLIPEDRARLGRIVEVIVPQIRQHSEIGVDYRSARLQKQVVGLRDK